MWVVGVSLPWDESFLEHNLAVIRDSDPVWIRVVLSQFPVGAGSFVLKPFFVVSFTHDGTCRVMGPTLAVCFF